MFGNRFQLLLGSLLGGREPQKKNPQPPVPAVRQEQPVTSNEEDAEFFKSFLLEIYQCSKPFDLVVVHTKPKTRMGTYNPRTRRIRINDGWGDTEHCKETAIHEYAHHIHFTEKGKTRRKEDPHGKEFWQIYGQLILLAKQKGLYEHPETII